RHGGPQSRRPVARAEEPVRLLSVGCRPADGLATADGREIRQEARGLESRPDRCDRGQRTTGGGMKHLVLLIAFLSACSSKINEPVSALDGDGCALCHTNITNAHPKAVVLCTNCHGQNTAVSTQQLADLQARFRDEGASLGSSAYVALQNAMHVQPKD